MEGRALDRSTPRTPRLILQPRDVRLINALSELRCVDREQASRIAPFHSPSRAKTRLLALVRSGHLVHDFVGTINGGRKAVYFLAGSRKPRQQPLLASVETERFIEHQLWLNEVYLSMSETERATRVRWERPTAAIPGRGGIIPDAFVELTIDAKRLGAFIEVDLGTESMPVWQRKVEGYLRLARSGFVQEHYGFPSFRVLVAAKTEDRIWAIRALIARSTDKVFWLADIKSIQRDGFWSPIWLRPTGGQKQPLP